MLSFLHNALANSPVRNVRRVGRLLQRGFARWINPDVRVRIGRQKLWMRYSHPLPFLLRNHPHYDTLLPRLGRALAAPEGRPLTMIDVGANIGDTAALMLDETAVRLLAIEPDDDYYRLLRRNAANWPGVTCVQTALADRVDGGTPTLARVEGTAHVVTPGGTTLDALLAFYPEFADVELLKIDTDGCDAKVLRGARALLASAQPVVFFELAPAYYRRMGETSLWAPFALLAEFGYASFSLYDNEGRLRLIADPAAQADIEAALTLAETRGYYYDVLAFPATRARLAEEFLAAERTHFLAASCRLSAH